MEVKNDNAQCMRELNDPGRTTCEYCGSDLSYSPDWDVYDDLNVDESDEF